jgi:hypothetical protein
MSTAGTAVAISEESSDSTGETEHLAPLTRYYAFLHLALDNAAFLLFCVSFSSLTYALSSWWTQILPDE